MSREIQLDEVKKHDNAKSTWVVIHDDVYDVTKFLQEHPGGADSLLEYAGKDGSQAFEDVGHSDDARELLKKFKIGTLPADQRNLSPCGTSALTNTDVLVMAAHSNCCRDPTLEPEKKWPYRGSGRSSSPTLAHKQCVPRVEPRVGAIVVPRERVRRRRRPRSPPPGGSSKLKWALIALAGAIVIGLAMKKYAS